MQLERKSLKFSSNKRKEYARKRKRLLSVNFERDGDAYHLAQGHKFRIFGIHFSWEFLAEYTII